MKSLNCIHTKQNISHTTVDATYCDYVRTQLDNKNRLITITNETRKHCLALFIHAEWKCVYKRVEVNRNKAIKLRNIK
jgi:hypothetical protein